MKVKSAFSNICLFAMIAAFCPALHARATFTRTGQYDPADEIQALKDEIERLKAEILRLENQLRLSATQFENLKRGYDLMAADLERLLADNQAFHRSQANHDTELADVRRRNAELEELQQTKQAEFDRLQAELRALQQQLDESTDKILVRQNELLAEKAKNLNLQNELRQARQDLDESQKSRAQNNQLTEDNAALLAKIALLEAQIQGLLAFEEELNTLRQSYAELEAKNKICDEEKAKLEAEIARLRQVNSEQQVALETALADHDLSEKEAIVLLQQQLDEAKVKNKRCDEEKAEISKIKNQMATQLVSLQAQMERLTGELGKSEQKNRDCDEAKKALEKRIAELEEALSASEKARMTCETIMAEMGPIKSDRTKSTEEYGVQKTTTKSEIGRTESTFIAEMTPSENLRTPSVDEGQVGRDVIEPEILPPEPVVETARSDDSHGESFEAIKAILGEGKRVDRLKDVPTLLKARINVVYRNLGNERFPATDEEKQKYNAMFDIAYSNFTDLLDFWSTGWVGMLWQSDEEKNKSAIRRVNYKQFWKNYMLSDESQSLFEGVKMRNGTLPEAYRDPSVTLWSKKADRTKIRDGLFVFKVSYARDQVKQIGDEVVAAEDYGAFRHLVQKVKSQETDEVQPVATAISEIVAELFCNIIENQGPDGKSIIETKKEVLENIEAELQKAGYSFKASQ